LTTPPPPHPRPGPLHRLSFALIIAQLGLMSLAWSLVAPLLSLLLPRRAGTRFGRSAISFIYRSAWSTAQRLGMMRIDSSALDALRDEAGGLIVAANHPTMLDALVVVARLPRGVCIMKAELSHNIFLGTGARLARYIRNDAGRGMVRDAVDCLKEGGQLVLFPEGTRMPPGETRRYGISGALLAAETGRLIVPVAHDAGYYWPRRGLLKRAGTIRVVFGPPIQTAGRDPREINAEAQEWIEAHSRQ